jgi:hypothetical protein
LGNVGGGFIPNLLFAKADGEPSKLNDLRQPRIFWWRFIRHQRK